MNNSALCLIFLKLCLIINNTGSIRQSVKYYVLNSISDDRKLNKSAPVTFLRFHPDFSADPWTVHIKKSTEEPSGKHNLKTDNEENPMQREKEVLNGKVLRVSRNPNAWFLPDFCKALERVGNFTMQYVTEVTTKGLFNETSKTWSGGMDLLQKGQADISAYFYDTTSERREYSDISITLLTGKYCLMIKKPMSELTFARSGYLKPFTKQAWCGMLLLLFASMALLAFMKKKGIKKLDCGRYMPKKFLQLWGILCQQGLSEFPRTTSHGIVYYAIFCFGLIIYSIYSSLLVSDLVNNHDDLPFSSMEKFVQNKLYKLMVIRFSQQHLELKHTENYPFNILKNKLMKEEDMPITIPEYKDKICRERVASLVTDVFLSQEIKTFNCSLAFICASWPPVRFSLAFQKNGPYTQALNYNILKLRSYGIMDHIFQRYFGVEKEEDPEVRYIGVTVSDISALLSILLGSFVLPLIVLFFEKVHFWYYEKQTAVILIAARRPVVARIRNKHISEFKKTIIKRIGTQKKTPKT